MSQDLHDALHRLADGGPHLEADPDAAWRAGRRRRRATQAGAVVATVAVFALVLGAVAWLPGRLDRPPVASSTADLGVPDRIEAVPERFDEPRETDLAIGRGAAAFVTPDGVPVVVGAADGRYHLLDLPGFLADDSNTRRGLHGDEITVALSPDGRSLAYGWAEVGPRSETEPVPSGVRVVDLDDGSVRTVPVTGQEGTQAVRFSWSPDSRWLVWTGWRMGSWTSRTMGGSSAAAGRIAPDLSSSEPVQTGQFRIDDRGRVGRGGTTGPAVAAADGTLAIGADEAEAVAFRRTPSFRMTIRGPIDGVTGGPTDLTPIGWVGDAAAVFVAAAPEGDARLPQLILVGPDVPAREIARVEGNPQGLSLATDLMSLDRPTVERPAPDWPWSTTRWVLTGLGVALLVGLGWVLVVNRRRRRLGGGLRGTPYAAQPGVRDDRFGPLA